MRGVTSPTLTAQFQLESADIDAFTQFVSTGAKTNDPKGKQLFRALIPVVVGILFAGLMFKAQLAPPNPYRYSSTPHTSPLASLVGFFAPIILIAVFWLLVTTKGTKPVRLLRTVGLLLVAVLVAGVMFKIGLAESHAPRYSRGAPSVSPLMSLASLFLPMLLLFGFWLFVLSANNKTQQKAPMLQHPSTVTLSGEEFRVSFGTTTVINGWQGVPRVENTATHMFLFTQPKDGYIVPRRAFASDEEFARFCDFARAHCEVAKPVTPPIAGVGGD